jgi:hypothetical protein
MDSTKEIFAKSSLRAFLYAKSLSTALIYFLCINILVITGCVLKLFEYPAEKENLGRAKMQATSKANVARVEILQRRSEPKIEKSPHIPERFIRKDLQNFTDREWQEGWEYLKSMDMITYASSIEGTDGILVPKKALQRFDPGDSIAYSAHSEPRIKLSFIHLSDVQLRDERVYMFRKKLTEFLDYISDGFDHDPDLVFYDHSYYLTLIGVMRLMSNRLYNGEIPSFMIHTGDALHMGVVSENYDFIYMANKLRIPWYNVFGNHDFQVYGNLSSKDVGVIDPNMGFQTVSSRYNFINMHGKGFEIDKQVYFSPDNAPDDETTNKTKSVYNGFDRQGAKFLEPGDLEERINKPCKHCPGYYHFEAVKPEGSDPGILVIVLDTSTEDFRFAKGSIYRGKEVRDSTDKSKRCESTDRSKRCAQLNWLRRVLEQYAEKDNWMVLAFGHHALNRKSFSDKSYQEIIGLFHNPTYNVVAYFCGHSHEHWVTYHRNHHHPKTFGFWEIKTDAIMEYPKKGSLVNIVSTDEKYWEITLQSFWPYFLQDLPDDAPAMLKNAKKCFEASINDNEGKKKVARYSRLDPRHHDVVLKFSFPKVQKRIARLPN